jgi:hypothetical protein
MSKGWVFVARHVARERVCMLSSPTNVESMLTDLMTTLKLLGIIETVVTVDDNFSLSVVDSVQRPCVVFNTQTVYTQRHIIWLMYKLLYIPNCIVLLITPFITAVPESFLQFIPCLLWNKPHWVNMPHIASKCPIIKKFTERECDAFEGKGHVLCIGRRNICCKVDLDAYLPEALVWQTVVAAQRRFRARRFYATVIQRFVKEWLYRPHSTLGKHIVERLTLSCQVK